MRARALLAGFVLIAAAVGVLLYLALHNGQRLDALGTQFTYAGLGQCGRVQDQRTRINVDDQELHDINAVLRDLVPTRAQQLPSVKRLRANSTRLNLEAPANCVNAVKHPLTYRPPSPVPFR